MKDIKNALAVTILIMVLWPFFLIGFVFHLAVMGYNGGRKTAYKVIDWGLE